jgi:hypothetical protein
MQWVAKQNPWWRWPNGLLPIGNLGCGMWACVDCLTPKESVFVFDPNNLDENEAERDEAVVRWTNAFWHLKNSFQSWIEAWLDGEDMPEPSWPSASWLRKRLWPDDPAHVKVFLKS